MSSKTPVWQKITAAVLAVLVVLWVVLDWHRFTSDFWPIDKSSVGPNLFASVVQWAIILIVAALLWPPTRRRIHAFAESKLAPIHARLATHSALQREHNEWMAQHMAKMVQATGQSVDPHPHFRVAGQDPSGGNHPWTGLRDTPAQKNRGFEHGLTVAPAPGAYAGKEGSSLLPQPELKIADGVGTGKQCDGYKSRYALRCHEFRGLRKYMTADGVRYYCHRHRKQAGPGATEMEGDS